MKLLFCTKCQDMVVVKQKEVRKCLCGNAQGMYIDELNAVFTAKDNTYYMMGFANYSVQKAISDYENYGSPDGMGLNFTAFVIPEPCPTFRRVESKVLKEYEKKLLTIQ